MNRFVWQRKTEFAEDNVQAIQQSSKIQLHSSKSWCNMCKHFPCLAYTFQPLISIYSSSLVNYHLIVTSPLKESTEKSTSCSFTYFLDIALRPRPSLWRRWVLKTTWAPNIYKPRLFRHLGAMFCGPKKYYLSRNSWLHIFDATFSWFLQAVKLYPLRGFIIRHYENMRIRFHIYIYNIYIYTVLRY